MSVMSQPHFGAPKTSKAGRPIAGQCTVKKSRGSRPSSGLARVTASCCTKSICCIPCDSVLYVLSNRLKMNHKEASVQKLMNYIGMILNRTSVTSLCPFVPPSDTLPLWISDSLRLNRNGFARYVPTRPDDFHKPTVKMGKKTFFSVSSSRPPYKPEEIDVRLQNNSLKIQQSTLLKQQISYVNSHSNSFQSYSWK